MIEDGIGQYRALIQHILSANDDTQELFFRWFSNNALVLLTQRTRIADVLVVVDECVTADLSTQVPLQVVSKKLNDITARLKKIESADDLMARTVSGELEPLSPDEEPLH